MPHPKPEDLDMTKHSDYFVWKDTSERVARRCDDTVDKKRVNSWVLKLLSLEGFEQPKTLPKNPGNAFSDAPLALLKTKPAVFWNCASRDFNSCINSNKFGAKGSEKLFSSLVRASLLADESRFLNVGLLKQNNTLEFERKPQWPGKTKIGDLK